MKIFNFTTVDSAQVTVFDLCSGAGRTGCLSASGLGDDSVGIEISAHRAQQSFRTNVC